MHTEIISIHDKSKVHPKYNNLDLPIQFQKSKNFYYYLKMLPLEQSEQGFRGCIFQAPLNLRTVLYKLVLTLTLRETQQIQ